MVENSLLRKNARAQLGNRIFGTKWMMMLVVCGILPFLSGLNISGSGGVGDFVIRWSVPILLFIIGGPLLYGVARTTVECVEGDKWDISHAFRGFSECFGKSVLLYFLQTLFTALWTLLLIIPGLVKSYSYALAFYIQQERGGKEREPLDIITQSRTMMDGHKWQLFCLDLSFIGWYLLGALCFGIGIFFVRPYHETARANFYEALKAELIASAPEQLRIEENEERGSL